MRVLVACEESQRVCVAFRNKGHEAYSCDIQECSGGYPEWHIKGNVLDYLEVDYTQDVDNGIPFFTSDGKFHCVSEWDLVIAHPPCTRLCNSGQRWLYFGSEEYRYKKILEQKAAIDFFLLFTKISCKRVAIENPVGIMSSIYRKPDCIYNPYDFQGETDALATCLWLKGLPVLSPTRSIPLDKSLRTNSIHTGIFDGKSYAWNSSECSKLRSKTPWGVANAMAEQWG